MTTPSQAGSPGQGLNLVPCPLGHFLLQTLQLHSPLVLPSSLWVSVGVKPSSADLCYSAGVNPKEQFFQGVGCPGACQRKKKNKKNQHKIHHCRSVGKVGFFYTFHPINIILGPIYLFFFKIRQFLFLKKSIKKKSKYFT